MGLFLAWKFRKQTKLEFIHSNRTQTGAYPPPIVLERVKKKKYILTPLAIPLALNFAASGECSCCI